MYTVRKEKLTLYPPYSNSDEFNKLFPLFYNILSILTQLPLGREQERKEEFLEAQLI